MSGRVRVGGRVGGRAGGQASMAGRELGEDPDGPERTYLEMS